MNAYKRLEFLIPSYKRQKTLVRAILSITNQVKQFSLVDRVSITVVDDCTPNFKCSEIEKNIPVLSEITSIKSNSYNKGMSLNIRDMILESSADFACILTDDDYLQPNSLIDIISFIDRLDNYEKERNVKIGSFFTPRYSYLEDGSLQCVVCKPFQKDTLIPRGSISSIRYLHNGFILTGLFFRPKLINFDLYNKNIDNTYFPVIYFSDLLLNYDCFFVNRNWFFHTVFNECHWEAWGKTNYERRVRIYNDYMKAVTVCTRISIEHDKVNTNNCTHYFRKVILLIEELKNYRNQIKSVIYAGLALDDIKRVDSVTNSRLMFLLAIMIGNVDFLLIRLRLKLSKLKKLVMRNSHKN